MLSLFDYKGNKKNVVESKDLTSYLKSSDLIVKTYYVENIDFKANQFTKIGTLSSIGATENKMLTPILIGKFMSIPSTNNFMAEIRQSYEGVFVITNQTQKLEFYLTWLEKK